jgi:hypothetical protein
MENQPSQQKSTNVPEFKLYSVDDLGTLPAPEWLIEGILEIGTLGVLFGPPGSGKSFAAVDMSLSVATGQPWADRTVKKGRVVYVVGEGTGGIKKRVLAWRQHHKVEALKRALFVLETPHLLESAHVEALVTRIHSVSGPVSLIVIDTLATSFVGGDENASKDMGAFIDACRRVKATFGCAVLLVHHSLKSDLATERGHSGLRGAADVIMQQQINKKTGIVTINNQKQKDDEPFQPLTFTLERVSLASDGSSAQKNPTSCVLVRSTNGALDADEAKAAQHDDEIDMLTVLREHVTGTGHVSWRSAVNDVRDKHIPDSSFRRRAKNLVVRGDVSRDTKSLLFTMTEQGRSRVDGETDPTCRGPGHAVRHHCLPFRGAGGWRAGVVCLGKGIPGKRRRGNERSEETGRSAARTVTASVTQESQAGQS